MRIFRIKARDKNGMVVNSCEYLGVEKLRMFGKVVYNRYNKYATAELYEYNHHLVKKWTKITDFDTIRDLLD